MSVSLLLEESVGGAFFLGAKFLSSFNSEYSYELVGTTPKAGDVIAVKRICYIHFGIYAGKSRVIHFASIDGDFGSDICVHEASLAVFENGSECLVARFFPNGKSGKLYSARETLKRARDRIGDSGYNLIFNNCEHFVTWCKTGESKSEQVDNFVRTSLISAPAATLRNQIFSQAADIAPVPDVTKIFKMFTTFKQENEKTKRDIAKYDAIKEVMLTEINRKYDLYEKLFKAVFAERKTAINKHFEIIDKGIKENNNELVLGGLSGLSQIVASSPFSNIGELRDLVESNKMIEM